MPTYNIELSCSHPSCGGLIGAEVPKDADAHARVLDYWHRQLTEHVRAHANRAEHAAVTLRIETPHHDNFIDVTTTIRGRAASRLNA